MQITHVHHIAIATPDPNTLAHFYHDVLGLQELRRFTDDRGLRSIWMNMAAPPAMQILMLERSDEAGGASPSAARAHTAPAQEGTPQRRMAQTQPYHWKGSGLHLLALAIQEHDRTRWERHLGSLSVTIEDRSEFTLYLRDPEGNRIALSWFDGQRSGTISPAIEEPPHPAEPG